MTVVCRHRIKSSFNRKETSNWETHLLQERKRPSKTDLVLRSLPQLNPEKLNILDYLISNCRISCNSISISASCSNSSVVFKTCLLKRTRRKTSTKTIFLERRTKEKSLLKWTASSQQIMMIQVSISLLKTWFLSTFLAMNVYGSQLTASNAKLSQKT